MLFFKRKFPLPDYLYALRSRLKRMATYSMLGGGTLDAKTPKEIVDRLCAMSSNAEQSREEFMEQMSAACHLQTGATISTYNDEEFVMDLMHNGFLTPVESN